MLKSPANNSNINTATREMNQQNCLLIKTMFANISHVSVLSF